MTPAENYVLMVEDNKDEVLLTLRSFERNGFPYKVVVARDGEEALNHLFGPAKVNAPRAVLLDLNLPKILGMEVLEKLRADPDLKDLPVIILTSSNHNIDREAAARLGANLYIQKPIDYGEFTKVTLQIKDFLAACRPSA